MKRKSTYTNNPTKGVATPDDRINVDPHEDDDGDDDDAGDATPPENVAPPSPRLDLSAPPGQMLPPRFQVSQKVLARDTDGILYIGYIRRTHYGQSHQLKLGILGTLECVDDNDNNIRLDTATTAAMATTTAMMEQQQQQLETPQWFFFVHFEGWKVNWDRWLSEEDVLEYADPYLEWQKAIQSEHRALLKQHKQNGRKVDGADFLKAWKPKLEALMNTLQGKKDGTEKGTKKDRNEKKKRKKVVNSEDLLEQEHAMRKQHLVTRSSTDREQIQLPSGLKRILVEEWEILTGPFGMVHDLDPKVTLRQVLSDYIQSKGVTEAVVTEATIVPIECPEKNENTSIEGATEPQSEGVDQEGVDQEEIKRREKEWIDMEDGICQLFDQALPTRLLYPREQVQFHALLEAEKERDSSLATLGPSRYYGCAHILRLCIQLPTLLMEQYDPKDDDLQHLIVKPMLAKVNDLLRFLQIHQEEYFPQRFRKLSVDEEKLEQKWIKRYGRIERKLADGTVGTPTAEADDAE